MTPFRHVLGSELKLAVVLLAISLTLIFGLMRIAESEVTRCLDQTSPEYYFPEGSISTSDKDIDSMSNTWFSTFLRAMDEPSLSCGVDRETYRFLWLRTFHHPISVRITVFGNRPGLVAVELDGQGGYQPGALLRRKDFLINEESAAELAKSVQEIASSGIRSEPRNACIDGAVWVFERAKEDEYLVMTFDCPDDQSIKEIGLRFLELAEVKLEGSEIY